MEGLDMLFRMLTVAAGKSVGNESVSNFDCKIFFPETKDSRLPGPGESAEQKTFKMGFANLTSFIGEGLNKPGI